MHEKIFLTKLRKIFFNSFSNFNQTLEIVIIFLEIGFLENNFQKCYIFHKMNITPSIHLICRLSLSILAQPTDSQF